MRVRTTVCFKQRAAVAAVRQELPRPRRSSTTTCATLRRVRGQAGTAAIPWQTRSLILRFIPCYWIFSKLFCGCACKWQDVLAICVMAEDARGWCQPPSRMPAPCSASNSKQPRKADDEDAPRNDVHSSLLHPSLARTTAAFVVFSSQLLSVQPVCRQRTTAGKPPSQSLITDGARTISRFKIIPLTSHALQHSDLCCGEGPIPTSPTGPAHSCANLGRTHHGPSRHACLRRR